MNEGSEHQTQLTEDTNVNIDIGFGDLHEEALQDTYTDYEDFDKLESLDSDKQISNNSSHIFASKQTNVYQGSDLSTNFFAPRVAHRGKDYDPFSLPSSVITLCINSGTYV
ncbi:hypothetical protein Fot_14652 [Forsythia ovata]|uniref:Uncharacterized protein n=1 Tax=Forsythia ovata TaxID=205694 RepID=A0ABD1W6Z1_9LAMI